MTQQWCINRARGTGPGAWTGRFRRLFSGVWPQGLPCRWSTFRDRTMLRRITSLDVELRILAAWSTTHNGLSSSGWHPINSIFGAYLYSRAYSRPVRHSAEQQGRDIPLSPPRLSGLAGQFPAGGLVEGSTVHVSPIDSLAPCSEQCDQGKGSSHRDFTMLASERMVTPGSAGPSGPASVATGTRLPSPCLRWVRDSPIPRTLPGRLKILRRSLRRRGILREATATVCPAHRPSTRALYHAKWWSICRWCSWRETFYQDGVQLSSPSATLELKVLHRSEPNMSLLICLLGPEKGPLPCIKVMYKFLSYGSYSIRLFAILAGSRKFFVQTLVTLIW